MAPVTNARHLYMEAPQGVPEPGKTMVHDTTQTIDPETVALNGGFLVKTLVLSVDPYMRGKMRDTSVGSYTDAYVPGQPLMNFGVGVVLRSENAAYKTGDHLYGFYQFQEYAVRNDLNFKVLKNEEKLPWSAYIGVCGMPGKTAYMAWKEYSDAKKGEVVFVSGGAGPVGSFVIQLAKMDGLKVIASAGTESKVEFLKSIGADVAFNYKTTKTADILAKEGPIDIYWDNVGGETLDAALAGANVNARFLECGMISGYNSGYAPIKNLGFIVGKSIKMFGFIVGRIQHKYDEEFYKTVPGWVSSGQIKYREHLTKGLDKAGQAFVEQLTGGNDGKSVVVVADE